MSETLTEQQLTTLKKLSANAAMESGTILGKWLRSPVNVQIDRVEVIPFESMMQQVGGADEPAVGLYLHVDKGISGCVLMLLPEKSALRMVDLLTRKPDGTAKEFNSLAQSALLETANILGCAYLNIFGKYVGVEVVPGTPSFTHDLTQSILSSILMEQAMFQDQAVYCQVDFVQEDRKVDLNLFFLPIHSSLTELV